MIVILIGAPGAGKGTQADLLVERDGFVKLSTGDALRRQVTEGTSVGKCAEEYMRAGKLVPDEILSEILSVELEKLEGHKIILDGYPRNISQVETLDSMPISSQIKSIWHLDLSEEEVIKRICGRRVCSQCGANYHVEFRPSSLGERCEKCNGDVIQRADDSQEKVIVRLKVFNSGTKPVLDHYKNSNSYHRIEGQGAPEDIYSQLSSLGRQL